MGVEGNRYRIAVKPWQADLMTTAHVGVVKDCCFAPNFSGIFVTCSAGGDIRVWNTQKRVELLRIRVPNLECNAILVSSGGDSIISGWSDGRVRAFLPETGKLKFVINDAHTKLPNDKDNNGCTALAIVPNERPGSEGIVTGVGCGPLVGIGSGQHSDSRSSSSSMHSSSSLPSSKVTTVGMHGGRTGDGSDGVTVVLVLALVLGMIAAAAGATEEVLLNLAASH